VSVKNDVYIPGYQLSVACSSPTTPVSGDPVRYGSMTGIAETDEDAAGLTSVYFGPGVFDLLVDDDGGGGIAVGDALFYNNTATGGSGGTRVNNNAATSGAVFFGFALATVAGNGTSTIRVLHVPAPGTGAFGAGTIAAAAIAAGAVDSTKMAAGAAGSGIEDTQLRFVADGNVLGGVPVLFRKDCADASADVDVTVTHKIRVLDAWGLNTGIAAHAANDTWQVKNGANAISDAVAKTATVNAIKRIATIDPSRHEIAAGGTLRITTVKATNAAVTVYVLAIRVA
jgi:predicted RecA/RadA family phage recombinase